jgi:hypothetical protein
MFDNLPDWLQYMIVIALIIVSYIITGRWLAGALYSITGETKTLADAAWTLAVGRRLGRDLDRWQYDHP